MTQRGLGAEMHRSMDGGRCWRTSACGISVADLLLITTADDQAMDARLSARDNEESGLSASDTYIDSATT